MWRETDEQKLRGNMLTEAIVAADLEKVASLLDSGISINQTGSSHQVPMFTAICHDKAEIVSLLLTRGVDINAPVHLKRSPLYHAADQGHLDVVRLLLDRGAIVDVVDEWGTTPMWAAALTLVNESNNVADIARWRHDQNRTPGSRAAIVEELIVAGADVNLCKKGYYPPAHFIRRAGIPRLIALMGDRGAPPKKRWFWFR